MNLTWSSVASQSNSMEAGPSLNSNAEVGSSRARQDEFDRPSLDPAGLRIWCVIHLVLLMGWITASYHQDRSAQFR